MERCAVLLLDQPLVARGDGMERVLRPTPQQRTAAALPVAEIRILPDVPGAAADAPPQRRSSLSLYRAATPRLTRTAAADADADADAADTCYFLSFVNGLPGHEQDYDRWYLEHHIHEVLAAPDFVAAQRFTLDEALRQDLLPPFRFFALYELRTRDLGRSIAALETYLASGVMTETPYKDPSRRLQLFAAAPEFASPPRAGGQP